MAKSTLLALLLLHITLAIAAATAVTATTVQPPPFGLEEACKRIPDTDFCMKLFRRYASQFENNDHYKMGHAAIAASLHRAHATKAFMHHQAAHGNLFPAQWAVLKDCLDMLGDGIDNLRQAAREFDEMQYLVGEERNFHKMNVVIKIASFTDDEHICYNSLEGKGVVIAGEIIDEIRRRSNEAVKASVVAQAFIK